MAIVSIEIPDENVAEIVAGLEPLYPKKNREDDLEYIKRVILKRLVDSVISKYAGDLAREASTNKKVELREKYKNLK